MRKSKTLLSLLTFKRSVSATLILTSLLVMLLLSGCGGKSSKTGSLSGAITLVNDSGDPSHDPVDYSGIKVAVYEAAVLDTVIVRINREYPTIGLLVNQETEFDHRLHNPVATTRTDGTGKFTLSKLKIGRYNLVYYKEGWGIRYVLNVNVDKGDNSLPSGNSKQGEPLDLYPQNSLPSTVPDAFVCKGNHTYTTSSDVLFLNDLTIESGATILLGRGCKLSVSGSLYSEATGAKWKITSLTGFMGTAYTEPTAGDRFGRFALLEGHGAQIQNGIITNMQDGLMINGNNCQINDMLFRNCGTAVYLLGNGLTYKNSIISNCDDRANYLVGSANVQSNIIAGNHDAFVLQESSVDFNNNYLIDNWIGARPIYGDVHIHHNAFHRNMYGISPMASDPLIDYNNFYGSTRYCIQTQPNYVQAYYDYSNPTVNYNNFFAQDQIIISLQPDEHPGYYGSANIGVVNDIDAKNNYWKAANVPDVLFDSEDSDKVRYKIIYLPKRGSPVPNAGIQN
jgi:hypothetical protein